jgi:hypothetical protein
MEIDSISERRRQIAEVAGMRETLLEMYERLYRLRQVEVMTAVQEAVVAVALSALADAEMVLRDFEEKNEEATNERRSIKKPEDHGADSGGVRGRRGYCTGDECAFSSRVGC